MTPGPWRYTVGTLTRWNVKTLKIWQNLQELKK